MSVEQAIEETIDDDLIEQESDELEESEGEENGEQDTNEEETGEVEIVVEGEEEEPASQPRRNGFQKRVAKLTSKVKDVSTKAEMLEEENKLLRLQIEKSQKRVEPLVRPNPDNFESDSEYNAALEQYEDARIEQKALDIVQKQVGQVQTQQNTANQERQLMTKLEQHYERADKLAMPNYEELEDKAIGVIGNDFAKVIMSNTDKSHLILGHLGANSGKAQELADLLQTDPVAALVKAVEIGSRLNIKTKHSNAPDPERNVSGGKASMSTSDIKLEKLRAEASKTGDMSKLLAYKKKLKANA